MTTHSELVEQLRDALCLPDVVGVTVDQDRIAQLYTVSIRRRLNRVIRISISFELMHEGGAGDVIARWVRKAQAAE